MYEVPSSTTADELLETIARRDGVDDHHGHEQDLEEDVREERGRPARPERKRNGTDDNQREGEDAHELGAQSNDWEAPRHPAEDERDERGASEHLSQVKRRDERELILRPGEQHEHEREEREIRQAIRPPVSRPRATGAAFASGRGGTPLEPPT